MAKIKVKNPNKFDVGISLINPKREQNVKPYSFTIIDEEDVYYIDSICTLFKRGMLVVEDAVINENINCVEVVQTIKSEEEIKSILSGNFIKMKSELNKIVEPHLKELIYDIAKKIGSELSGGKLKFLAEYCGKDLFLDDIGTSIKK